MFSSETISRDMTRNASFLHTNSANQSTNFKTEGDLLKSREFTGSDFFPNQAPQQGISGLARYRSAPSSFLAALLDSSTENSSSGDESEAMLSAWMNSPADLNQKNMNQMQFAKQEVGVEPEPRPDQNGSNQMGYENAVNRGGGAVVGSYSVGMESQVHLRMNNGNSSNLVRQSSSPAGFFNGFGAMSNHMNFSSSSPPTSSRFMPSIPENGHETIVSHNNPENGQLRNNEAAFPDNSWNDSPFTNLKRNRDGDLKMFSNFNGLQNQNGEGRKNSPGLVHHMSLPKTSAEMAEVEKFLQFQQDTVPCQIRAKRGFATHPRSIAERIRRTRISEKMKKLQDLFPNMDKQTSTADMLDLAVEYIKDLQKQVQTLNDTKAKCVCPNKLQQTS